MFIPTTPDEVRDLGWGALDVILVSGDTYIDSPSMGISIIGHALMAEGFRVGIIAQPALDSGKDITRLGEPLLFWGITSGSVDSMVSNYSADRSRRRHDDLTPGGENSSRPDRACIAYTGLIRHHFRNTAPIVLGGIEASLRRVAHYDYWQDRIRRSILLDSKADIIVYGMGELTAVSLARRLRDGEEWRDLPGICHIAREAPLGSVELPAYEEVADDREAFARMYLLFCRGSASPGALSMFQRHGDRFLVHNPPCRNLSVAELDTVYEYPYENDVHPYYASGGGVRAMDTIRFSITSHRGCFGGCSFCSIALHQGRSVVSRSEESIIRQAEKFSVHPLFRGVISDVGGPTGNMYGMDCDAMTADNPCASRSCLGEAVCSSLHVNHKRQIDLLSRLRKLPGVKHVFVASGVRYDLVLADSGCGEAYLEELVRYHVSGLLRVAPEHTAPHVLKLMGKPSYESLKSFQRLFSEVVKKTGTGTGLSFYLMAAHPGCTQDDMVYLAHSISPGNGPFPGKVQIFTPTPSTLSTLMYFSGSDPFTGMEVFVERDMGKKTKQRNVIRTFHRKTGQRPIRG